jgi:hypothetical protein
MELACKIFTYSFCGKPVYVHFILHLISKNLMIYCGKPCYARFIRKNHWF